MWRGYDLELHRPVAVKLPLAVRVEGPKSTGLAIKEAAIAQGVSIQLDFVLSEEVGDRRTKVIGDKDEVTVHPHAKFIAVAPDDNS